VITLTFLVITGLSTLVTSCGDSGGLAPSPLETHSSPSGVWNGPFTSLLNGAIRQVTGLISEDRDAQFLAAAISQRHYSGNVAVIGETLSATLTVYLGREGPFLGMDGVESIVLDGTIAERNGMLGDYAGDEDHGSFNLNYNDIYEDGSSLDLVSGLWMYTEAAASGALYTVTLDIDANGAIFGSDINGCVYSGGISIIDERFNGYRATINVSSCIRQNGNYSGLAYLSSIGSGQMNQLMLGVSKSNRAFAALFQKL